MLRERPRCVSLPPSLTARRLYILCGRALLRRVKAAIGSATGSEPWKASGEQTKAHAVESMKAASDDRDPSNGFGGVEQKLGEVTGCEGMANEGAASKK